jgi:hypothetical protein
MHTQPEQAQLMDDEAQLLAEFAHGNLDYVIPQLARDQKAMRRIESVVHHLKTAHELILGDSRAASALPDQSIHLVVTSPPYWTLMRYNEHAEQLGHAFMIEKLASLRRSSR